MAKYYTERRKGRWWMLLFKYPIVTAATREGVVKKNLVNVL
jgi:hypothetical protein